MRKIKPYRQWFLQIPILFCSGSLVYFGWPYFAVLAHAFFSVKVFIRSSNIETADDRQEFATSHRSENEIAMFAQRIKPLVLETENDLSAVVSTQDGALNILTNSLTELQDIQIALDNIMLKSKGDSEVTSELAKIIKHTATALNNSIRRLQLGDINKQSLVYTKQILAFLNSQLETIKSQSSKEFRQFLEQQPEAIRNQQQTVSIPLSS